MKIKLFKIFGFALSGALILSSCAKDRSTSTGWEYNNYKNGGFEKVDAKEQETGPGLVFVQGGTFTMGRTEQDVMFDWNARAARFTVGSFYMDRTEVTNLHWQEYMNWMKRVYYKTYPHVYKKCLPDTLAWRKSLGYREKFVNYYLRHPSYRDYPVVGVSWLQANDFCKWRTDRVNEAILVREGILKWHFADAFDHNNTDVGAYNDKDYKNYESTPQNMFSTENYLNGNYMIETGDVTNDPDKGVSVNGGYTMKGKTKDKNIVNRDNGRKYPRDPYQLQNYDPVYADVQKSRLGSRPVKMEDGILLPAYRLPTEAEWEFAALGLIGNLDPNSENINDRRIYPWDGHYVRDDRAQFAGAIQANFSRGKGDMMGVAGQLNDGADVTCRVDDFWPNDYGLYHMAGNVSEWVMDVYRPLSSEVLEEFMPFRGNVYTTQLLMPDGLYDKPVKADENMYDVHGMKEFVNEYARIIYLANTKNSLSFNSPYSQNSSTQKDPDIVTAPSLLDKAKSPQTKQSSLVVGDTLFVGLTDNNRKASPKPNFQWDYSSLTSAGGQKLALTQSISGDTVIAFFGVPEGIYDVKLTLNGKVQSKKIQIYKDENAKKGTINWQQSKSNVNSRQDPRAYKYNAPSQAYVSNYKQYSKNDSIKFTILDDINAILDTAIILANKENLTKGSHYLEVTLFGSKKCDRNILLSDDIRSSKNLNNDFINSTSQQSGEVVLGSIFFPDPSPTGSPADPNKANGNYDKSPALFSSGKGFSAFDFDHYLAYKFPNYNLDPDIVTWILNLRNGLTEYVTESKGKQRWRNVTVEENAGRLNYRKDDYRDYMDGDLESSIFYNNDQRIKEINEGKRDKKQVMYQSNHENRNLEDPDQEITPGVAGWPTTLISDKSRVYKGGSWADKTYWMSSGNRRFLDEDKSSDMIGFRCAMDRVGSTRPNKKKR